MKAHTAYLLYVLRHKWHVAYAGVLLGVPLWQLLVHDWTKFTAAEWGAYVAKFYGPPGADVAAAFEAAWNNHQKQNRHHWQFWVLVTDKPGLRAIPMPQRYVLEMVADWYGAGMAIKGTNDVEGWYLANKDRLILEDDSRRRVEQAIQKLMLQITRKPID